MTVNILVDQQCKLNHDYAVNTNFTNYMEKYIYIF